MTAEAPPETGADDLICEPRELERLAAQLASVEGPLALDTEGDGMFRYRTRLCVLQLSTGSSIHVIDTLAVAALDGLSALLGPHGPEKILHDASFDARVLHARGLRLANVFDTAVAARFLGFASTGLSSLLQQLFGLRLPKHHQQADWGLRPLTPEAIRYLEDDVRHLHALASRLRDEVRARDIESEVREECAYVLREAQKPEKVVPPWTRIKGAITRPPDERARLYELSEAREALARELDVPPGRLVPGGVLERLAQEAEPARETIRRLLGPQAEYAARFEEALARAAQARDAPMEEVSHLLVEPPSPAELTRRKRRRAFLVEFREREAKARNVDLQVVLPGHCLSDIVELPRLDREALRAVPGFGEARFARYAERLLEMPGALRA